MAGELGRTATEELLQKNVEAASRIKEAVEKLYLDLLALEPRDYELRKKVDYVGSQANWISEKLFYATTCRHGDGLEVFRKISFLHIMISVSQCARDGDGLFSESFVMVQFCLMKIALL